MKLLHDKGNTSQAVWVGLGTLSTLLLSLVSAAILSRYLSKAEYGTYKQVLYVYNSLLFIFTAGLPKVFGYYLPRYSLGQGKTIVWRITTLLFFSGMLFSIFLFLGARPLAVALKNPELISGLQIFAIVPTLLLPTLGLEGILATYKKTPFLALYNVVTRLIMLVCIVLPVLVWGSDYRFAIYGWIVASAVSLVVALVFKNIPFRGIASNTTDLSTQEILSYSLPIVVASLAGIAIKASDQFYISRYFGAETFAEFSNGFIRLPFASMITGAAATVLMPVFSKLAPNDSD